MPARLMPSSQYAMFSTIFTHLVLYKWLVSMRLSPSVTVAYYLKSGVNVTCIMLVCSFNVITLSDFSSQGRPDSAGIAVVLYNWLSTTLYRHTNIIMVLPELTIEPQSLQTMFQRLSSRARVTPE